MSKVLVLLSGGQDSATCLALALNNFETVSAISFDYGQRHQKELNAAKEMCITAKVNHTIIEVPSLKMTKSALTTNQISVQEKRKDGLPSTFVPGRNILFLTIAASLFPWEGEIQLMTGVCETDYSGYPDCRKETMNSLEQTLSLGLDRPVKIFTPLMYLDKAATVNLAKETPLGWQLLSKSWTCYEGGDFPCGNCPSCVLRAKGFSQTGLKDPALET